MDKETRTIIKDIIAAVISPLVTEITISQEAHARELERLTMQTNEHSTAFKLMDDKRQNQIDKCQVNHDSRQEKTGERIGKIEQSLTRIEEHMKGNDEDIENIGKMFKTIQDRKDHNLSQWLVGIGLILLVLFETLNYLKGVLP